MWWEWLIIGLLVVAAAVYLVRLAILSARRFIEGRGCPPGRCGRGLDADQRGGPQARELVQLNTASAGRCGENPK